MKPPARIQYLHRLCGLLAAAVLAGMPQAAARAAPEAWPTPFPDDPRCGRFGITAGMPGPRMPVAPPIVYDRSPHGELAPVADLLRNTLTADLELSGCFDLRPHDTVPTSGAITWPSDDAFDYLGWHAVGAWLVVTAQLDPAPDGVAARLDAWLTEEADRLSIGASSAVVEPARVARLAHRWTNALLQCLTGLPGVFGTRIAYAKRVHPGEPKEIWYAEFGSRDQVPASRDGAGAMLPAWAPGGRLAWTGYRRNNPDVWIGDDLFSARVGQNSGVAFSPDGRLAAITLAPDGNADIYLLDARTGKEIARLTSGQAIDTSPAWSPDGTRLAFVSDRDGGPQVWLMDPDGLNPRPLPLPGSYNTSPDWSPDGREIAYQSRGEGDRFSIRAYEVDSGAVRNLRGGPGSDEEPSWSPDGRLIAFTSSRRGSRLLYVMDRDGGNARAVFPGGGEYWTPAWERPFAASTGP